MDISVHGAQGPAMSVSATVPSEKRLSDLLLGLLPFLLAAQLLSWLTFFPNALRGHSDFRQLYVAGYMVRTGEAFRLYDYSRQSQLQDFLVSSDERALPFIRPAYQALIFAPFSWFPYRTAYLILLSMNLLLLALIYRLLVPEFGNLSLPWRGLPAGIMLAFYPISLGLMQGQDSILLLALLAAALHFLRRGGEQAAGALVGLGLFKFQIVLPIALLFLLWRRWRFCVGFSVSVLAVGATSLLVAGVAQARMFLMSLLSVGGAFTSGTGAIQFPLHISIMANLRGLVQGLAVDALSPGWIKVLILVLSAVVVLWLALQRPEKWPSGDSLAVAILASALVSYYLFIHDLSVLLIPILIVLSRSPIRFSLFSTIAAIMWIAPALVFIIPGHFYLVAIAELAFLWSYAQDLSIARVEVACARSA
jgi:hypothetical protein